MALLPPAQLVEHPADLVIDLFGTFLGKRSERMIVRWREHESTDLLSTKSSPTVAAANDDTAADYVRTSVTDSAERPSAASETTTADIEIPDGGADEKTSVELKESDVASSTVLTNEMSHDEPSANQISSQLLKIWATVPQETPLPAPLARLHEQLDEIAETTAESASSGVWKERAVPMSRLRSVTVSGRGITVSSDLINALVERGIALSFLSGRGQPIAQLSAPGLGGTVQTRRSQLAAYESPLGVTLAVEFIRGKLRNQKHQLQYSGKYLKATDPGRFERLVKKVKSISALRLQLADFTGGSLERVRDKLMGYEGTAARLYWEGVAILLEGRIEFPGRLTRGAIDPVNSALNYGYGILYGQVSGAVVNAGLELYAGFLHVDRPGKPALVLDLVEEFRAPIVDRSVLAIVNQGVAIETDAHGLTAASRKLIAHRVLERLATAVPYEGKRWPLRHIIQNQARHLAVAVRGEREYRAFASRW